MANRWIDISVPIDGALPRWPGDPSPHITRLADLTSGDSCTVSSLAMSLHAGTHIDAPSHYLRHGKAIRSLTPEVTVGRARVLHIRDRNRVTARELSAHGIRKGERILLKTRNSSRCWKTGRFLRDFVSVSADAARYLADRRIQLLGVDYLSAGSHGGDGEEVHRILLGGEIWVLEGLNLAGVSPGSVDLICLCMNIPEAEGAPARAYLREDRARR